MTNRLATRIRKARRPSTCPLCHGPIVTGQKIGRLTPDGWAHVPCIVAPIITVATREASS